MWMAWRLQRSVYLFFVVLTIVLIGVVIANGLHTQSLWHQYSGVPCHGGNGFEVKYQNHCLTLYKQFVASKNPDMVYLMVGGFLCGSSVFYWGRTSWRARLTTKPPAQRGHSL